MTIRTRFSALVALVLMAAPIGLLATSPAGATPPTPVVTSVSPSSGSPATSSTASATTPGGTSVTITGQNFTGATAVDFGGVAATAFTVDNDTTISATSPTITNSLGNTFDVTVTTAGGTSATGVDDEFTYPYNYTSAGTLPESSITIGASAQTVGLNTQVTLTATASADVGPSPDFGLSILDVTDAGAPVDLAHIGMGTTATAQVTETTAQTNRYVAEYDACNTYPNCPPDPLTLAATEDGGVSTPITVTWAATPVPTVSAVSPASGSAAGGTNVTITGTHLTGTTAVDFGSTPASGVTVHSDTSVSAVSPSGSAGTVDVTVTTGGGTSATGAADHFTYSPVVVAPPAPTVTGVSPGAGSTAGGTSVTINGTNLTGTTAVDFGSKPATGVTVHSDTSVSAISPSGTAGTVHVTVTTAGGTSATNAADDFTYSPTAPAVTAVSPGAGPTAGGTSVTISGTNLSGTIAVDFGSTLATGVTVHSDSSVSAVSPPGTAGTVHVTVTTAGGTSATSAADDFTYEGFTHVSPEPGAYWEVAADGGIFSFNAPFEGSMGGKPLFAPIVGMAPGAPIGG